MFFEKPLAHPAESRQQVRDFLQELDGGWTEMTVQTEPPTTAWMYGEAPDSIFLLMDDSGMIGDAHPYSVPSFADFLAMLAIPFRKVSAQDMLKMVGEKTPAVLVDKTI